MYRNAFLNLLNSQWDYTYNHCRLMFHLACQLPTGFEFPQLPLSAGTDWFYQQISKPQNKIVPTVMITGSMDLIM